MFYHLHLLHVCSFTIHPLVINHWQLQTNESCMKQKYLNGFRILNLFLNLIFSELNCQFVVTLMTHLCLAGSTWYFQVPQVVWKLDPLWQFSRSAFKELFGRIPKQTLTHFWS